MKKIKDVYKEVEDKKENEVAEPMITMAKDDFIEEHKNLIKILRAGDKKALLAEAKKQEAELKEEAGETVDDNEDDENA